MFTKVKAELIFTLLYLCFLPFQMAASNGLQSAKNRELKGIIIDQKTKESIPFASIYIHTIASGTTSDIEGLFHLFTEYEGKTKLTISCVGYQSKDVEVSLPLSSRLEVELKQTSYSLNEITVLSKEGERGNSVSLIDKATMQHIQPSSFTDILQLIPGHSSSENSMSSANFITMRQAGSDNNTSLGTAFTINDANLNNDANMQAYYGLGDDAVSSRITTSKGVDMRTISTDMIESVEIVRGIPSAKYGDATAGVVKIELKTGHTPWEARAKVDLKNQLFSIGKGLILPKKGGALNLDLDYATYNPNPRNNTVNYTRTTFSTRYENMFDLSDNTSLKLRSNISYTGSFDDVKTDAEALTQGYLKTEYKNLLASLQAVLKIKQSFVKEIKLSTSYNTTKDRIDRYKLLNIGGTTPLTTISMEEGIYDTEYLPVEYFSSLIIDGKPITANTKVDAGSELRLGKTFHTQSFGLSFDYSKNNGDGPIYDLRRPPYSASSSARPRAYRDIPALQKLSFYVEDNTTIPIAEAKLLLQPGIRLTTMPQIGDSYTMSGKWYAEPRINTKLSFPQFKIAGEQSSIAITAGIGQLYKFPTLSQLYPDKIYADYVQLNYYSLNEVFRYANVKTYVINPVNYNLEPAKNIKQEIGLVFVVGNIKLDVTVFKESMKNGFSTGSTAVTHNYLYYNAESGPENPTSRPTLDQFEHTSENTTFLYQTNTNSAGIYKKGIEYSLDLGRITPIYTHIWMNGAWFNTRYKQTDLQHRKTNMTLHNRPYKYTGIYEYGEGAKESNQKSQFNTNIYFDTHIPFLRMIFTTSIQNMWFTSSRTDYNTGRPIAYLDEFGIRHEFTQEAIDANSDLKYLIDTYNDYKFVNKKVAMASFVNIKLSKEIGNNIKLACYLNNVLNYLPDYTSAYGVRVINRNNESYANPYFGAELNVKF